jgi:hypothetical protein
MTIPNVGGGYQLGDGNLAEIVLSNVAAPVTAAGDATLSVAQLTNGIILGSPGSSAAAYTLPLAATLDAALGNAKIGSAFDFSVVNVNGSGGGIITMTTNTGWSLVGLMTIAATAGTAQAFRARKSGDATWALYRLS